jgi:D-3-phosphoglycerate dehydrogenase / 2-oxoglutarate reductase
MMSADRKLEVLITMAISETQLERLRTRVKLTQAGWGFTGHRLHEDDLVEKVRNIDVLLAGYEKITDRVIHSAPELKLVGIARANPVNVSIDALNVRKIPLIFAPGRNAIAAAEFTIGLMLSQARQISFGDRLLRSGKYLGEPINDLFADNLSDDVTWNIDDNSPYITLRGVELCGRTLGLIGFGNVASHVARIAIAMGMRVITHTPLRDQERASRIGVTIVSLNQLLSESDFISIHCNVTKDTKALLDTKAFGLMKPNVYLINTARASMIDQKSLIDALREKRICGAALDVFWYEPLPANHPLLKLDNVTLTPHLAGSTFEVPERHSRMIVDDLFLWMNGLPPRNLYNSDVVLK